MARLPCLMGERHLPVATNRPPGATSGAAEHGGGGEAGEEGAQLEGMEGMEGRPCGAWCRGRLAGAGRGAYQVGEAGVLGWGGDKKKKKIPPPNQAQTTVTQPTKKSPNF